MLYEGKYFLFDFKDSDRKFAEVVISTAEAAFKNTSSLFRIPEPNELFLFKICSTIEDFISASGKTVEAYQPWMVGHADYNKRFVCLLSPSAASELSFSDILKIVKHEVAHIVFDQLGDPDDAPIGISEGIAVYIAEQIDKKLLDTNDPPSMVKLNEEAYFYENSGYDYSGVYVRFFIEKFGIEAFKNIYTAKTRLEDYLYQGFEKEAVKAVLK